MTTARSTAEWIGKTDDEPAALHCTALGCSKPLRSKTASLCKMHYSRIWRGSRLGLSPSLTDCQQCGNTLRRNQSKFCSQNCHVRFSRGTPNERQCVVCHKPFPTNEQTKTCSAACDRIRNRRKNRACYRRAMTTPQGRERVRRNEYRRKALKRATTHEDFAPLEIFLRDNWRCQLCGKAVERNAKWPHPKFPTLDHIIPFAKGGTHTKQNVQCAHLRCNLLKSDGPGGQLRMFG